MERRRTYQLTVEVSFGVDGPNAPTIKGIEGLMHTAFSTLRDDLNDYDDKLNHLDVLSDPRVESLVVQEKPS